MTNYEYILNECKKAHYHQWQKRGFANPPSIFDSWGKSQK